MSDSQSLNQIIKQRIKNAGDSLPFDAFMQAALYEPGLGYYESKTIFGAKGDFVTAADLGPWLSLGFSDLIFWAWQQMGEPEQWTLLEQGGGSGRLMVSTLNMISQFSMLPPSRIISVEQSSQLQDRQKELFARCGFEIELVSSLAELEASENVIALSNELPDAFPVRCFRWKENRFFERGVVSGPDGFDWQDADQPLVDGPDIAKELLDAMPDDYFSEWNPNLAGWQQDLSAVVQSGFVFCVDYGYSQQEYYRPGRVEGSLLAHIKQQVSEDVLVDPGEQDITAHIDFTALKQAGEAVGFESLLWMSQGGWLAQSPSVQAFIQALAGLQDKESMHLMAHAKRMLMPFGMGELFKLLVQSKGLKPEKPGYLQQFDHLDQL
jgi:SAM-dependent MidA family methyltransferase